MNRAGKTIHVQAAWERGLTGAGITAAVLDTGISGHPDLAGRILDFRDFVNGRTGIYDDYGHGTHVSGILAGTGAARREYRGIAPGCALLSLKVLDHNGNGKRESVMRGISWVLKNRQRYGVRILNISVGTVKEGDSRDERLVEMVEQAWDAGLVVVCAAGNLGPGEGTITAPGNSRKVITVGISDEFSERYSGRGPTRTCVCKPDISAPGTEIWSCNAFYRKQLNYYCRKSGTSMATPMVSGAIALLLQKEPWLGSVEVKMRLREAAVDLGLPRNCQGWGQIDVKRLLRL